MINETEKTSKSAAFVTYTLKKCQTDKGFAARLKRADNPNTEFQSWEHLAAFHVNLEKEEERLPYALIAATIAKTKAEHNGRLALGQAIARCYDEGNNSDQAKAKLRRVLACNSVDELCRVLRPLLSLIESRLGAALNYEKTLSELLYFRHNAQAIKSRWAQDFYGRSNEGESA